MYYKIALNIFFILLIFIFQISFVSSLFWWLNLLNFILVSIIFILVYFDFRTASFWAIGFGVLLDIYSFNFFGIYTASIFLTLVVINFILVALITNRSVYSFLTLTIISIFFFQIITHVLVYIFSFLNEAYFVFLNNTFWLNILKKIIINSFLTILIFYIFSFISNKFKPVFLIRKK